MGLFIWIVDAHRGDGKRFIVRADEKLTAFLELEAALRTRGEVKPVLNQAEDFPRFLPEVCLWKSQYLFWYSRRPKAYKGVS
jgi:hypothetical protein